MRIVRCLTLHFLSIISLYNISISHGSNNINPHVIREPNNNANNSDSNNNENEDNIPNYIIYHAVEDDEDNELNDSAINDGYIGEEQQIKENDNSIINDGYLDNNFSDYSENNQNIDNNNINNITSNDMVIENSDNNIENNSENINRDNLYPGRVNVLNSMTFTKDNSHNRMQQTKFNSVPQENNEAIQVYTTHGMSNVNITGNLEVNDITDTQTLESNNMKIQTN
ncbi:MAG: hypothetical protein IJ848_04250 [Alphaproteobacteria bacterium]|nr:hypothetical protein [Alphaproteobacteria bacterium]